MACIVAARAERRRRRPDLMTYIGQRESGVEPPPASEPTRVPFGFGGTSHEMPPVFARRIMANRRSIRVAQGAMMIVVGLSTPAAYIVIVDALGLGSEPALLAITVFISASFIVVGLLAIVMRNR